MGVVVDEEMEQLIGEVCELGERPILVGGHRSSKGFVDSIDVMNHLSHSDRFRSRLLAEFEGELKLSGRAYMGYNMLSQHDPMSRQCC